MRTTLAIVSMLALPTLPVAAAGLAMHFQLGPVVSTTVFILAIVITALGFILSFENHRRVDEKNGD